MVDESDSLAVCTVSSSLPDHSDDHGSGGDQKILDVVLLERLIYHTLL